MRTKIGVMGSAAPDSARLETGKALVEKAEQLGETIAKRDAVLLTGATTGLVYVVGKAAHDAGCFHVGISPGSNEAEHVELYKLPVDACDTLIYTGFGVKGRNVVLVHDEEKIIGCLTGTGGVAAESEYLLQKFGRRATAARMFTSDDPDNLLDQCLQHS